MALTGRPDGPALHAPGDPAGLVARDLQRFAELAAGRCDSSIPVPGVEILGERAAFRGLRRRGPWSCGGRFRVWPSKDGHVGLSLPRPSDLELLPALVQAEVDDPWEAVAAWLTRTSTEEAVARARLLDLAVVPVDGAPRSDRPGAVTTHVGGPRRLRSGARVVDLTSLWAGPMAAHLLALAGAEVVKVESQTRPDGARVGDPELFDLLHHGHRMVSLDLTTASGRDRLRRLVGSADLVLEGSRPRALRRLGVLAEKVVDSGTSWVSITAAGRHSDRIGFGDDVAAGAGLVLRDRDDWLPCGDALADPLTGVRAAVAALECLLDDHSSLVDVSMHDVSVEAALAPAPCSSADEPVTTPVARTTSGWAAAVARDGDGTPS